MLESTYREQPPTAAGSGTVNLVESYFRKSNFGKGVCVQTHNQDLTSEARLRRTLDTCLRPCSALARGSGTCSARRLVRGAGQRTGSDSHPETNRLAGADETAPSQRYGPAISLAVRVQCHSSFDGTRNACILIITVCRCAVVHSSFPDCSLAARERCELVQQPVATNSKPSLAKAGEGSWHLGSTTFLRPTRQMPGESHVIRCHTL
jgi:hypothetical protein